MVELRHVTVGYGSATVLADVSLSFPDGAVTALVGPNGCGKSTLLKAALGLVPIRQGQILLDGLELAALPPKEVALRAAYLAQSRTAPNITARRMVLHGRFPHLSYPRRYRPEDYAAVEQAMARTGADGLADRPLEELSGGQRQKVYLAMALAQDTHTVLLDEPTTYLDVGHQLEVMSLANQLAAEGRAVVLVLHDLALALSGAQQVAVLAQGGLRRAGTPEEVFTSGALDRAFGVRVCRVESGEGWHYFCTTKE